MQRDSSPKGSDNGVEVSPRSRSRTSEVRSTLPARHVISTKYLADQRSCAYLPIFITPLCSVAGITSRPRSWYRRLAHILKHVEMRACPANGSTTLTRDLSTRALWAGHGNLFARGFGARALMVWWKISGCV